MALGSGRRVLVVALLQVPTLLIIMMLLPFWVAQAMRRDTGDSVSAVVSQLADWAKTITDMAKK
ncbi:hypothetical protein [Nonomuraea sediminis]|uniref:hypothetical protein n=1 Tax=Nonomuraea sediminis TaxID=2835864 RepID=UPI001BDC449F|nr:hypothetical protein [Nonomuraea sediminis]